jgi:hypothetical protein
MAKRGSVQDAGARVTLMSQHPADFYVYYGSVTGMKYVCPRGIGIPVNALDAPAMKAMWIPGHLGCCGSSQPERQLFVEV